MVTLSILLNMFERNASLSTTSSRSPKSVTSGASSAYEDDEQKLDDRVWMAPAPSEDEEEEDMEDLKRRLD